MKFRPCIDVHNGKVKQIVGGSLRDTGNQAVENFISEQDGAYYAGLYRERGLFGGHVILLNARDSEYYDETKRQALMALSEYPGGLQVGGGICASNAKEFLDAGASHVIVTSYVFVGGQIHEEHLKRMTATVGKEHLVLDLSCRRRNGSYYIVTDRWQRFTDVALNEQTIEELSKSCDELLVHAVDVEGKASGIEEELVRMLAQHCPVPVTYAGGVGNFEHLRALKEAGRGKVDVTIGSALDLFGGTMEFEEVLRFIKEE